MVDTAWARRELREAFSREAEWRREKAAEYPEDGRNLEAAERYDRLAATVADVPEDLMVEYCEFYDDERDLEVVLELRKRPFHQDTFASATDFVGCYVSRVTLGVEPF